MFLGNVANRVVVVTGDEAVQTLFFDQVMRRIESEAFGLVFVFSLGDSAYRIVAVIRDAISQVINLAQFPRFVVTVVTLELDRAWILLIQAGRGGVLILSLRFAQGLLLEDTAQGVVERAVV